MAQYRVPVLERFSWQEPIINILNTPPAEPSKGDRYIVGVGTAAWEGKDKDIAWWDGTAWKFDTPAQGWVVANRDDDNKYYFTGAVWQMDDLGSKQDLVPTADENSLADFDADGQVKDSGVTTASVSGAVSASHTQNTDTGLDEGGDNPITAAEAKQAYDRRANFDSDLGVLLFDIE